GDRAFRPRGGYAALLGLLEQRLGKDDLRIRTNTVVQRIDWGSETIRIDSLSLNGKVSLHAKHVLVTVPVGVLQARPREVGAIKFPAQHAPEHQHCIAQME